MSESKTNKSAANDLRNHPLYQAEVKINNSIPDISKYPWHIKKIEEAKQAILQMGGTLCED